MSDRDRISKVNASFAANRAASVPRSICGVSVGIIGVSAACVTLMNGINSAPVCASDERASKLDDLQHSLGEGPTPDAYAGRSTVYEPDLRHQVPLRWQHFTPSAIELGMGGVFAFPLQVGANCLGVLTVYQNAAGDLSKAQESDGFIVADTIARSMLRVLPEGDFEILAGAVIDHGSHRAEFHQASGMIAVQLGVDVSEAAVRIRAYAFGADRTVAEVAREIVDRKLRLDDDRPGSSPRLM
jgi:hypothetical protein